MGAPNVSGKHTAAGYATSVGGSSCGVDLQIVWIPQTDRHAWPPAVRRRARGVFSCPPPQFQQFPGRKLQHGGHHRNRASRWHEGSGQQSLRHRRTSQAGLPSEIGLVEPEVSHLRVQPTAELGER